MIGHGKAKLVGEYGSVNQNNDNPDNVISSRRLGLRDSCCEAGLLGLYSFGGSGATVAIIRSFLVDKGYLSNAEFAEVFALAHCLPGPTGAQILLNGVTKGTGSVSLGLIAMGGFILPVAFIMGWLGCVIRTTSGADGDSGLLASPLVALVQEFVGLAAISIIAVSAMALVRSLVATDQLLQSLFCCACASTVAFSGTAWVTPLCISLGGATSLVQARFAKRQERIRQRIASEELGECVVEEEEAPSMDTWSALSLVLCPWVALALCLYVEQEFVEEEGGEPGGLRMFSVFFRIGIMNYGGSSVMVAVLLSQLVPYGLMTEQQFLLGFGAVQLLPGPEINIAA